jgi:putative ABC transport system substrate-binding protein
MRKLGGIVTLVVALTVGILGGQTSSEAQQAAKTPRIGVLFSGAPATSSHAVAAFDQGMRDRGYGEREIVIERRFGEARIERMAEIAAELVGLKVDVIVASTDAGISSVRGRTQTIPIVMVNSTDPVETGFVASLARPGGNVTGLSTLSPELSAKRLELLKEAVPGLTRVAIIWNPDIRGAMLDHRETEDASRSLHLQLQSIEVRRADDLERAFSAMIRGRAEGLIVPVVNPIAFARRVEIAGLAQRNRLPSIFGGREFVEAGGLLAYGPNIADGWRRAATYVDKILKGAKPGELPVEQPTTFELAINLKTAKAIGVTIPPTLVRRADHLIR